MARFEKGHKGYLSNLGKIFSEETRRKMSNSKMGKPGPRLGSHLSEESKIKIGLKSKGRKMSDETKKKMSLSQTGLKRKPMSAQGRENIRIAHLGFKPTLETRKKLSEAQKGHKMPEHVKKMVGGRHRGALNPQWKGGVTPLYKKIRKSPEYKLWRSAVYQRDNYTCVWCGYTGKKIVADHIKPFAVYPELRFAIDNGRTLCIDCHKTTDTYGKNYNLNK